MSSCHLLLGCPLDLFPLLGCHSVHPFVHLLSFNLAIWPAHFHFYFSMYSMISMIFVLFLISEHGILSFSFRSNIFLTIALCSLNSKNGPTLFFVWLSSGSSSLQNSHTDTLVNEEWAWKLEQRTTTDKRLCFSSSYLQRSDTSLWHSNDKLFVCLLDVFLNYLTSQHQTKCWLSQERISPNNGTCCPTEIEVED